MSPSVARPSVRVTDAGSHGVFLVAAGAPGAADAAAEDLYARMADTLRAQDLAIVQERIFGSLSVEAAVRAGRARALQRRGIAADGPLTYVQGRPVWGEGLAGAILRAVPSDADVRTLTDAGRPCGRAWRQEQASVLALQDIRGLAGGSADDAPAAQAARMIDRADHLLRQHGARLAHAARTWFYLHKILDWYADFNRVRNARYTALGLMPDPTRDAALPPASTGVGADVPGGAAGTLDLLAVTGDAGDDLIVRRLHNPRQRDAWEYGSAFSRATAVRAARECLIEVSGTAAVDEAGRSLYPGDAPRQIGSTLERVSVLLAEAGASLADICAATVFVKRPEFAEVFCEVRDRMGLPEFPAVCVVGDICRPELLFEMDAEVVLPRERCHA